MATHRPRIEPGVRVKTSATRFGVEWAKNNHGQRWRTAVVYGTVQSAAGLRRWNILWDGDDVPLESTTAHLRLAVDMFDVDTEDNDEAPAALAELGSSDSGDGDSTEAYTAPTTVRASAVRPGCEGRGGEHH